MKDDELLQRQAALITVIARQGEMLGQAIAGGLSEGSSKALNEVFKAVDELRDGIRAVPYYPAVGETVTIQGTVDEIRYDGASVKIRFGEDDWNTHSIDPRHVVVRPVQ